MKRSELLRRILITAAVIGAVGTPFYFWARTPLIHARVAENSGWNPGVLYATVGQPLYLHLTSDDVTHGFAVGQMDKQAVDILPGQVTDVTLTFDKPGTYAFYCTRWRGLNHWRMRGTIEVSGSSLDPEPAVVPLYVSLGLDIDAPHDASIVPKEKPSAALGQQLTTYSQISIFINPDFYRAHSPYQAFEGLDSTGLILQRNVGQLLPLLRVKPPVECFVW